MSPAIGIALAAFMLPLAAAPAFADCADDLRAVLERSAAAGPYRADMSTTVADMTIESYAEVVPSEAIRMVTLLDGQRHEIIAVGDRAWMSFGKGWEVVSEGLAGQMEQLLDVQDFTLPEGEMVGVECKDVPGRDGRAMRGYGFGLADTEVRAWMVVEVLTGLPVEMQVSLGEGMGEEAIRFTFDPSIAISPPPGF